ncbi:MAG: arsenite efflux MFS transporter ArsK [Hyphomicrobiales bacterium]|nr:arsenite efflux MFS transporter ArsK [Hyphomicrobiales bacterium]
MTALNLIAGPERPQLNSTLIVIGLGATQVIGYGTLYYAFSILAASIAKDFNWSLSETYAAFSAALLIGGLAAPFSGRWVDRFGAGQVMALGSAAAAATCVASALAPSGAFFVVALIAMEAAATLVLYDAAFAALAQVSGQNARRDITNLTLIAGFASTIFWPLTSLLNDLTSWRHVYLVFAALRLAVCLPIHFGLMKTAGPAHNRRGAETTPSAPETAEADRPKAFMLVMIGFTLGGFVLSALLVHMAPLLVALGLGSASLLLASLFGPAQVLVRILNMSFGQNLHPVPLAIIASAMLPAACLVAFGGAHWRPLALLFVVLTGFGSGLASIVRGTVPLALFGAGGYGARLGKLTAVRLFVAALAPFAFAYVMETQGVTAALLMLSVFGGLAALCFILLNARRP